MDQEFAYWLSNHLVPVMHQGRMFKMVRYNCEDNGPRPESYAEDFELARQFTQTDLERRDLYWELKTGAESGWDYSSRWFVQHCRRVGQEDLAEVEQSNLGSLQDTKTRQIVPVDLNCYFAKNAKIMAEYHRDLFDDQVKASQYEAVANDLTEAVEAVLWDPEDGIWYDYDFVNCISRKYFTPSNLVPLWTDTMSSDRRANLCERAVQYALSQNLTEFPGGVPTTFVKTGQQWDFPNCWPPLQHMVVKGLENTGLPEGQALAFELAEKAVRCAYLNFCDKGHMFEKYDATCVHKLAGGGEYEIQLGFGWTNGVILDFLAMYGDRFKFKDTNENDNIVDETGVTPTEEKAPQ